MEPNYHPDALANYNYKFDQNSFMCYHIGAKLHSIFGWGYTDYYGHERTPGLKNMKNFDFTQCAQYKDLPSNIKNITQIHKEAVMSTPHSSDYYIDLKDGNLELIYEFN
jgi:hypothetical protein